MRPNLGIIEPQQTAHITVILQPSDDSILNYQGHHKFQILFTTLEDNASQKAVEELWQIVNPDLVSYHKLKCFFKLSEESNVESIAEENFDNQKDASEVVNIVSIANCHQ